MSPEDLERSVLAWRKGRMARLTARDGWLSLIGKTFLDPGIPVAAGAAAGSGIALPADKAPGQLGTFELADGRVRFTPAPGVAVQLQAAGAGEFTPIAGPTALTSDARGRADRVVYAELVLEVMERGDAFAVRVRDVSRAKPEFAGFDHYPIRAEWRIVARFEPYTPERAIELVWEAGMQEPYFSPGAAVFEKDGATYRLDPVFESDRKRLWIVFADQTSRSETYGAGRFLYAPPPENGEIVLDFNRAFNPPCAFSPYTACPLPPFQNRLALRVEAGEKRPNTDHA